MADRRDELVLGAHRLLEVFLEGGDGEQRVLEPLLLEDDGEHAGERLEQFDVVRPEPVHLAEPVGGEEDSEQAPVAAQQRHRHAVVDLAVPGTRSNAHLVVDHGLTDEDRGPFDGHGRAGDGAHDHRKRLGADVGDVRGPGGPVLVENHCADLGVDHLAHLLGGGENCGLQITRAVQRQRGLVELAHLGPLVLLGHVGPISDEDDGSGEERQPECAGLEPQDGDGDESERRVDERPDEADGGHLAFVLRVDLGTRGTHGEPDQ